MVKLKRKPSPPGAIWHPEDLVPLAQIVAFLADRDHRAHDTDRTRKARVRARIASAVSTGKLTEVLRQGEKCFVFGRVAAWAQASWPGRYDDLPAIRDPITGGAKLSLTGGYTIRASGSAIPTTLAECQSELIRTRQEKTSLEEHLILARLDAERLRPDAEAWRRQVEANRGNARQPRPRGKNG